MGVFGAFRCFQSFFSFRFSFDLKSFSSYTIKMSSTVFSTLIGKYSTWAELSAFLRSAEGGSLHIQDYPGEERAILRYVKGHSNMSLAHTRALRSVVWNTVANRPVSVTSFKSEDGESFPLLENLVNLQIEEFVDGVMIGQFYDAKTESWRIHTRSTLDAKCRYFSKNRTFAELFEEAATATFGEEDWKSALDKTVTYTWTLSHPENRIVCPVSKPRVTLVNMTQVNEDATVTGLALSTVPEVLKKVVPRQYMSREGSISASQIEMTNMVALLAMMNGNLQHQGIVIKTDSQPLKRWKMRSVAYKTVRQLRGNTARRDFLWMDLWSKGSLVQYLSHYPEERADSNGLINRWKTITQNAYKTYVDAFKARTLDRKDIEPKLRPFVYGLHNHYLTVLKPAHKSLDWKEAVKFMNERDTAQKIYALNWEIRRSAQSQIPLEPPASSARVPEVPPEVAEDSVTA